MVTAKDVAELAGVAQSTVSYVMSGSRSISPETRARVEAAMRELNYHPNANARALAGCRANVIGLVTRLPSDITIASTTSFIETITDVASAEDHDVVLVTSDEDPAAIERLVRRSIIDALVVMDIRLHDPRLRTIAELDVPAVLIGLPEDPAGLECVEVDAVKAGELAVQELVEDGCHDILLIGEMPAAESEYSYVHRFEAGARRAADAADARVEVVWSAVPGWDGHREVLARVLAHRTAAAEAGRRTGVVGRTPQSVDGFCQLLMSAQVALGEELPLVGLCTDSYAASLRTPITNVSPEPRDVSLLAMRKLFALLRDEEHETSAAFVTPRLTRRETTGRRDPLG
ncbi:LacI family DNA-binding transcriptional regulator [Microbacterium sp. USHLN186]|uniref:LacI family DNA-binding transcriptional regulator n=1 Tax=Microbacterium sp. USHLN186 TaxID=3081286 RepID=UPI003019DCAA